MGRRLGFAGALTVCLLGCAPGPSAPLEPAGELPQAQVEAPAPAQAQAQALLSPVAFREGPIGLASAGGQAFAFLDGEPIPLSPGQAVARDPTLGPGLLPKGALHGGSRELVAFAGTLRGEAPTAHLVVAEHFERASSDYTVYTRQPDRWVGLDVPKRGGDLTIKPYYSSLIETEGALLGTEGALLGLRRYTVYSEYWDYGDPDDPDIEEQLRKLDDELAKLPRGFAVLAGSPPTIPALPPGMDASLAIAIGAGEGRELIALGYRHRLRFDDEPGPARLLTWAAGASEARVSELPGLADPSVHDLRLWAAGDTALVGGLRDILEADDRPYLARREPDGRWAEIPLELPGVDERVASASQTPSGELWVVTGAWNHASAEPCRCLWRKPKDGPWALVELEPVSLFRDAEPRWVHLLGEQSWVEVPGGTPPRLYPAARELVWAEGALWLTAELGQTYPTSSAQLLGDLRSLLYSSVAVASAAELIATDQLYDERFDRRATNAQLVPGSDDCQNFYMLIAEDPEGAGREAHDQLLAELPALAKIATIDNADSWASATMAYVGTLDGRPQLVIEASSWNPKSALALVDGFARVLGRRPTLDCRPRKLVRVIGGL